MPITRSHTLSGVVAVGLAMALAACGSAPSASSPDASGTPTADMARAQATVAPLIGHPTAFPINTPLARTARGKRIAYMDCGSPICGLFYSISQPAAQALGMNLTRIKAGLTADSVAAAFDSVVQSGYDGVFVPAIQPSLWQRGLDQLVAAKIPVVTSGIVGADPAKVAVGMLADAGVDRAGKELASYVVTKTAGKTDVVFYSTPEIAFNPVMEKSFAAEMTSLCPGCKVRSVDVPAATLGSRAPALISDDLQAHPGTTTAVFAEAGQTSGLPSALKTAGIDIQTLAAFPDPQALQLIKAGDIDAGLGIDIPVVAWTLMDSLARLTTGQKLAAGADQDIPPVQLLTKADLTGDISQGWTGYPDFPARFTALWKAATP